MAFRLLGISGALRAASTNTALLRAAAEEAGDDVAFSFADIDLPPYDGDVEDRGYPDKVLAFAEAVRAADAIVISTPEYNKHPSGALKNALDWQSRLKPVPLRGKPVAVMSATAGAAGGQVAQFALCAWLRPFAPRILPGPQLHVGGNGRDEVFSDGRYVDAKGRETLAEIMRELRALAD